MPKDINKKKEQLSDEELNRVLARWAKGEVPLPEDFHPKVMAELERQRALQQEEKGAPFFLKKKTWLSVAAAAVFAVLCIPVVQTQFGEAPTDTTDRRPVQQVATNDKADSDILLDDIGDNRLTDEFPNEEETEVYDDLVVVPEDQHHTEIGGSENGGSTILPEDVVIPDIHEPQKPVLPPEPEVKPEPEKPASRPSLSMPAFPLSSAFQSGSEGLTANENNNEAMLQTYQSAIRKVDQDLGELYGHLAVCEKKLAASPEDVALKAEHKRLTDRIQSLEKERKQINGMISALRQ